MLKIYWVSEFHPKFQDEKIEFYIIFWRGSITIDWSYWWLLKNRIGVKEAFWKVQQGEC